MLALELLILEFFFDTKKNSNKLIVFSKIVSNKIVLKDRSKIALNDRRFLLLKSSLYQTHHHTLELFDAFFFLIHTDYESQK